MKITKNWFYKLSEFKTKKIVIEDNLIIIIFDDSFFSPLLGGDVWKTEGGVSLLETDVRDIWKTEGEINIEIWENSRVEFYWVFENSNDYKINFTQNRKSSILMIKCLLLSKDYNELNVRIYSELAANFVKSNVKIISIVWNNGLVNVDWIIQINKGLEKVEGKLKEENLFLWSSWKIKGKPILLVESLDVNASHSCKMERISDEKLFYLRSRWIKRENALSIMIKAKIENQFSCINMVDNNFYEKLIEKILLKII
jgi:hypothetical protein